MKVCLFRPTLDKKDGGPARSIPTLAKGLQSAGVNVVLMTFETEDLNLHVLDETGVSIIVLPKKSSYKYVESVVLKEKFDIIHIQSIWDIWIHRLAKIARDHNIKYMMTPRGTLEAWGIYQQGFVKKVKKLAALTLFLRNDIQKADCILTTAEEEKNSVRNLGFTNPIAVIPNGIEFSDYPCRTNEYLCKVRKQVLFLSRINPKKGIDMLIDAWNEVAKTYPDWNLLIVGNGEEVYIKRLKDKIHSLGLDSVVKIGKPAFGKEKYELYATSSLFVLPTYSENFGMVIAEALACGVPVITTRNTPWKILEDTESGWWIELSADNVANTLKVAMNKPLKELFAMGQKGTKMVRKNFNYEEVAKKLVKVYEWVLSSNDGDMPNTVEVL